MNTVGLAVYNAYPTLQHPTIDASLTVARKIDFDTYGLEAELDALAGTLKPQEQVRGWVMYQYPADLPQVSASDEMRLTLTDSKGMRTTIVHNRATEQRASRNRVLENALQVAPGQPVDLSALPRRMM
ncbi:MAG TPA: hypothetical protein VGS27_17835 [Candidatus Sulfotelmatobacter sp.]|nr:hypothetical protein [Candidatus Sulfotelmatobacter sp.]